jgi:predicted lipid-binding transport protein (Tim44 family)
MDKSSRWGVLVILCAVVLMAHLVLEQSVVWARAGGGSSSGSRGSRSMSPPARPSSPSPGSNPSPGQRPYGPSGQPSPATNPGMNPSPTSSFTRNPFVQGLAGGLLGGVVGNMLFGNRGYSAPAGAAPAGSGFGGSGIGLMDLLLIGGGLYFLMRYLRKRREQAAMTSSSGSTSYPQRGDFGGYIEPAADAYSPAPLSPAASDLQLGLEQIARSDPYFNENSFKETAQDIFFSIQAAWMNRSLEGAENIITDEMATTMAAEFADMKKKGQINRLENIAVRKVEITEAWQEAGMDYITVLFTANLLDYTVDDKTAQLTAGDQRNPVKFEEFWTFCRASGQPHWELTAINQTR